RERPGRDRRSRIALPPSGGGRSRPSRDRTPRLLQLDASPAERTRGRHRVDGPAVDDHVDLGEPTGIGQDGCCERPEGYSRADPWSGGSAYAPPELRLL